MKFRYDDFQNFYTLLDQEPSEIEEFKINMDFVNPFALILPASFIYEQGILMFIKLLKIHLKVV